MLALPGIPFLFFSVCGAIHARVTWILAVFFLATLFSIPRDVVSTRFLLERRPA